MCSMLTGYVNMEHMRNANCFHIKSGIKLLIQKFCLMSNLEYHLENYPKILFNTNFLNKTFATFIIYSDNIFSITDLPRGLGLNFFSLVLKKTRILCRNQSVLILVELFTIGQRKRNLLIALFSIQRNFYDLIDNIQQIADAVQKGL